MPASKLLKALLLRLLVDTVELIKMLWLLLK